MQDTVLLIDASAERRALLRLALERRGCVVAGEAGSVPDLVSMIAGLDGMPSTVLVGATVAGSESKKVAHLLKRAWPDATVIHENRPKISLRQAVGA